MKKFTISKGIFCSCVILLFCNSFSLGATRIAIVSGNWSSTATWGGNPVPTSSDDVVIKKDANVTVDIGTAACKSIMLGDNLGNGTLSFNSGSKCTVSGNITLGNSANKTGSIDMSHGGTLQAGGSLIIVRLGTFSPGTGTMEYNGSGNQSILSTDQLGNPYYNLTISTGGIKTLNGNTIVTGALTINAGKLVIPATRMLTVKGNTTLNAGDCLVMTSNAFGTGSFLDNGTITGTGTADVQRYLTTDKWHYVSSPVSNATAAVFMNDYLKTSDPTTSTGWGDMITKPEAALQVMRGYACWKPSSYPLLSEIFTGILNTGDESFTGNRTATDPFAGWHLVGNPYPSAVDLGSSSISWGQFEPTAYIWDPTTGDTTISVSGGNYRVYPVNGFSTHSRYLPATQGFYAHIRDNFTGDATLTFKNQARVQNGIKFLKDAPALVNGLMVTVKDPNQYYSDVITVYFDPAATAGYDPGQDAYKLEGMAEAPQLYTKSGESQLTCNSLPFSQKEMVIPMGFYCSYPGHYTLTADSIGTFENTISITLEDLNLGQSQDLRQNPTYTFIYQTTDNPDRFALHFLKSNFGTGDKIAIDKIQVYSFNKTVYVRNDNASENGDINIYNILGIKVFQSKLGSFGLNAYPTDLPTGVYIVNVIVKGETVNQKVVLH